MSFLSMIGESFFTAMQNETLMLVLIILFVLILICLIYMIVESDKKNLKNQIKLENRLDNSFEELENSQNIVKMEPVIKKDAPIINNTKITVNKIPNETLKSEQLDLESITRKMSETVKEKRNPITDFEVEQEENSIISYEELLNSAKEKKYEYNQFVKQEENEALEKENFKQEKIEKKIDNKENKVERKDFFKENKRLFEKEIKKFKNSEIISPVYGIQEEEEKIEELTFEEDIENQQFLNNLKILRENLKEKM